MNNLSVLQKALILACTPLLFQVAFAAILFTTLGELNQAIQTELTCQSVIAAANSVYQSSLEGATRGATNVLTSSTTIESILTEQAHKAREGVATLRRLTGEDREQLARIDRLAQLTEQIESACLAENRQRQDEFETNPLIQLRRYKLLEKLVAPLAVEVRAIVDGETLKLKTTQVKEKRNAIHWILFWGLSIDLAICCALSYFFTKGMVERLSALSKSATDFARADHKKLELNGGKTLDGTDELARLDENFRRMAKALTAAKVWRQEYLSMLNHDIRLPLTAAISVVAFCQRGAYGKLLATAPFRLNAISRELTSLVDLLEDLLEVERINAGMLKCNIQDCDLNAILQAAREKALLTPDLKGQSIYCFPCDLTVSTDAQKLTRLLSRLLAFIVQRCPEDAQIKLRGELFDDKTSILVDYPGPPLKISNETGEIATTEPSLGWEYLLASSNLLDLSIDTEVVQESVHVRVTLRREAKIA